MDTATPTEQILPNEAKEPFSKRFIHSPKLHFLLRLLVVAVLLLGAGAFAFLSTSWNVGERSYEESYTFVPDKISQSAAILIHLPKGVSRAEASGSISFDPVIQGTWKPGEKNDFLLFEPAQKLEIGKYYSVKLASQSVSLEKDFLVDEDPRVITVLPAADSEANEYSRITIVFNRPMIPLTTLEKTDSALEKLVEITPKTSGKFKWVTTRNLQFIPADHLTRSAHYNVHIRSGFRSIENLSVPEVSYNFTTRPLRYEGLQESGALLSDQPIRIAFNQFVDLEKTKSTITIRGAKGEIVPLALSYAHRVVRDANGNEKAQFVDKKVIEIRAEKDRFGREKMWNFSTTYQLNISGATPEEGDIPLRETRNGTYVVSDPIVSVTAESPRSLHVEPDTFDPQGKLWITFAEPIDKVHSKISAPNLKDIVYGEKCEEEGGEEYYDPNNCKKVADYNRIGLIFNDSFTLGQTFNVTIDAIVNQRGLKLNDQKITRSITVYAPLKITKTIPKEGDAEVPPSQIVLCSNTPLRVPEESEFGAYFKSNYPIGKWDWGEPYRSRGEQGSYCAFGEYESVVTVGLAPERKVSVELHLTDDFGQKADKTISFTTKKVSAGAISFSHLQKAYDVTSPERTKLVYAVENMNYVNLDICKVAPTDMLKFINVNSNYYDEYGDGSGSGKIKQIPPPSDMPCIERIDKRIDLPDRFWTKNYFEVNLKDYVKNPLGHYVLTFTNSDYRRVGSKWNPASNNYIATDNGPRYERTLLTVTNLAVQQKRISFGSATTYPDPHPEVVRDTLGSDPQNLYWVTQFGTLSPVSQAKIQVLNTNFAEVSKGETGSDGVARLPVDNDVSGVIVSSGDDSAIVSASTDKFEWASSARSAERAYIYTDRPIYRPGQKVYIKGIARVGYDGNYEQLPERKIDVTVRDSKYQTVVATTTSLTEFGTFGMELALDAQVPLGTYNIETPAGYGSFEVEEYVPAPFNVAVASDKDEYIAGETAKLNVDTNYFFGVPLEGGEVTYSIVSQDYYFDRYTDGNFNFGNGWYYSYNGYYGDKFVARGKATIGKDGKGVISQNLDFSKLFKEDEGKQSKIFVANITVKNANGRSVSARKSFIVHRGEYYLGVSLDKTFLAKGDRLLAKFKSVDTQGKAVSTGGLHAEMYKIHWNYFKRREVDGSYYYQSEEKKDLVQKADIGTDSSGNTQKDFSVNEEGEYSFVIKGVDGRGNEVSSEESFYVYGSGQVDVRPTNNESLDLATDKSDVNVGDKVNVVIKSPYANAKALVTIERGRIFEYQIIDVTSNFQNYSFTVKEPYIPNIYVSVLLLSPHPDVKYGRIEYHVNRKQATLDVSVKSNKDHYLPGEEVGLDVEAKDWQGKPVSAELSVAVVDMSVLALKGNPKKNPVLFFYDGLPLAVSTESNVKNILYEAEIPVGTKGGSGGGTAPGELAKKKRGEFRDTAYWEGTVRTGADGKAHLTFRLPDNLTSWQIESLAVTKDTKLGVGYQEFTSRKDVMVVPLQPRFIVPGDKFSVGAKVFNQTDTKQTLKVSLEETTLTKEKADPVTITLNPKDTKTIYFSVSAPTGVRDGSHEFTLSAKNKDYEDTVTGSLPITRNDTFEAVATANYTTQALAKEYLIVPDSVEQDRGGLTIESNATLSIYLSGALTYLFQYPYGCSEQVVSKLGTIAVVKKGLSLKNIGDAFKVPLVTFDGNQYSVDEVMAIGLNRIYQNQSSDGGFAYYKDLRPDYYLTLHVLNTLGDIKAAGYSVHDDVMKNAARYIYQHLNSDRAVYENKDSVIVSVYALSQIADYANDPTLASRVNAIVSDKKFIREDISSESLAYLALLSHTYAGNAKNEIFDNLGNRVVVDGRGAYVPPRSQNYFSNFYESPIENTALFIKAYVVDRRENQFFDKMLRWILKSRDKDGAWGSPHNTVAVVDAMSDYLAWKKENESQFKLTVLLDDAPKGSIEFGPSNILQTFVQSIPISDISANTLHAISFQKENKNSLVNGLYYDMSLKYFLPIDKIAPRDEGLSVTREFYHIDDTKFEKPVLEAKEGDVLKGHLVVTVPESSNFVSIEDFIPAGMELVNLNLATENAANNTPLDQQYYNSYNDSPQPYNFDDYGASLSGTFGWITDRISSLFSLSSSKGNEAQQAVENDEFQKYFKPEAELYPNEQELHDDRVFLFNEHLAPGTYRFDYLVRALNPGVYHHLPATVSELYFPEIFGRTRGELFTITGN